ncbi:MAG: methionine--tRNA ligase [Gemmatimonadetes bacterium]|nr:methionine--tRNA ligase [Gemmatimonadota bacterium]NNK61979.1 methionine--tRNA ligase [Gemmatimonadota bacterium]
MSNRTYLTTPIYYASGAPHIGHAYTTILADALARFSRQRGDDVLFLTGTDEHGQKIQEEAERRGMQPIELCDAMADRFRAAWEQLEIGFDRFIRTTEAEHRGVVEAFVQRLYDRGHIYEGSYAGWYCVHEERYWTQKDLGEGQTCPDCGRPVQEIEEKNWFFRMGAFQEALVAHIEAHPDWIRPEVRRNEVLGFLQQPLGDLSISRPRSRLHWGIPLPFDPDHVTYVWVDALINYLTASGAIDPALGSEAPGFDDPSASWWPADLHIIGKDILTTHAVYWPTLLMGAGLPLPRRILAHGWWVVGETKMSKSLGNVIDPLELRETFGTDAVRWYLLREMPTGSDASYTPERFLVRYDELAKVWGNLAQRAISMIVRYREGTVPDGDAGGLDPEIALTLDAVEAALAADRLHEALAAAMDLARTANGYVETREPWAQAKDPTRAGDLDDTLATLARLLGVLSALFEPVCPERSAELARRLGLPAVPTIEAARMDAPTGRTVEKGDPLFPRVEL